MLNRLVSIQFPGVVIALAGLILLSGCSGTWKRQKPPTGFGGEFQASLRYGPIDGYVQTPRGGAPGTTTRERPTFNELDIDDFISPEVSMRLHWREHGLYAGGSLVRLDGNSVLDTTLVSQGATFPAGTPVESEVQLDWYRFGYQYRFAWTNEGSAGFSLSPAAGVALLNFDYRLEAEGGLLADRGYLVGSPQLGLGSEWTPPGRFSIAGGVFGSIPEVGNLFILSAQVTGSYRLWGRNERGGRVFLGVGYDWLDYEDNQEVPNHIRAEFGPMLLFGISTRF